MHMNKERCTGKNRALFQQTSKIIIELAYYNLHIIPLIYLRPIGYCINRELGNQRSLTISVTIQI